MANELDSPLFPIVLPNDLNVDDFDFEEDQTTTEEESTEEVLETTDEEQPEDRADDGSTEPDLNEEALVAHLNLMKELGYIEAEDEITLENAEQIIKQTEEKRYEKALSDVIESLSPQVKELVMFGLKGGENLNDFIEIQQKETSLNFNINEEEDQKKIVARYLRSKGNDDFVIEAVIERLEDSDRLKTEAKLRLSQMKAEIEAEKQAKIQEQEQQLKQREVEIKQFQSQVFDNIKQQSWNESSKKEIVELIYGSEKSTPYLQKVIDSIVSDPKLLVDFARVVKQYFDPKEGFKINTKTETIVKNEFQKKLASSISKSGISKATTVSNKNLDWRNTDIAF